MTKNSNSLDLNVGVCLLDTILSTEQLCDVLLEAKVNLLAGLGMGCDEGHTLNSSSGGCLVIMHRPS
jgi:hypothetical protein